MSICINGLILSCTAALLKLHRQAVVDEASIQDIMYLMDSNYTHYVSICINGVIIFSKAVERQSYTGIHVLQLANYSLLATRYSTEIPRAQTRQIKPIYVYIRQSANYIIHFKQDHSRTLRTESHPNRCSTYTYALQLHTSGSWPGGAPRQQGRG